MQLISLSENKVAGIHRGQSGAWQSKFTAICQDQCQMCIVVFRALTGHSSALWSLQTLAGSEASVFTAMTGL